MTDEKTALGTKIGEFIQQEKEVSNYLILHKQEDLKEDEVKESQEQAFKTKKLVDMVEIGDIRHVQEFLDSEKMSVSVQDEKGISPLMAAASNGRVRLTEFLIEKGADLDMQDLSGETALMKSISNGYNRTAQLLINSGANLNLQTQKGLTALMKAVHKGDMDIVEGLIKNGVALDTQDSYGFTALMHAVQSGFGDMVLFLIVAGADLDKKDVTDKTARDWANVYSQVECMHLLDSVQEHIKKPSLFTEGFKNQEASELPQEEGGLTQGGILTQEESDLPQSKIKSLNEPQKIGSSKILAPLDQEKEREG